MQVETQLNFQKRKGHGALSVRRPRFSGVQGESLDLSFRWSGDVVCYREQEVILTVENIPAEFLCGMVYLSGWFSIFCWVLKFILEFTDYVREISFRASL